MRGPLAAVVDLWREQLVALGFADDGERLRGPVRWQDATTAQVRIARVEIMPSPTFPFRPPRVILLDPGEPLEATFHANADGSMCLWTDDWAVDDAPWRDPAVLLARIASWLERTTAGWPDDDDCDLERYLEQEREDDRLVLYDASALVTDRAVRTTPGPAPTTIVVTNEQRRVGDINTGYRRRRKDQRLAWVADIGAIARPLRDWSDVAATLGPHAGEVDRLISIGAITFLLLLYTRSGRPGALAVRVRRTSSGIRVTACESAGTSAATRSMRAGPVAGQLADTRIAVVGCGAIGSFATDLLFRSGVRHLTLIDGERLRPGNVVRHLAGAGYVGWPKARVVRERLAAIDLDVVRVHVPEGPLVDLEEATALVRDHQVVLDATGSGRTSSLLASAAEWVGRGTGHAVVSACVQRDGDVVRVDRMPLRRGETHLPALPLLDDSTHLRERGCGSPISPTPPGAVIAAAELAHRVVLDEVTRTCALPASIADVRCPQPEPPYDRVGVVTADLPQKAAS